VLLSRFAFSGCFLKNDDCGTDERVLEGLLVELYHRLNLVVVEDELLQILAIRRV